MAILREEGCNGEMEMAGAVSAAGLEPWDVTITDLLEGKITLDRFRMIIPVGGFTYADDPEAAKGWAITLMYNEMLKKQFEAFRNRKDTLSLGICNGNQLLTLLGWAGQATLRQSRKTGRILRAIFPDDSNRDLPHSELTTLQL